MLNEEKLELSHPLMAIAPIPVLMILFGVVEAFMALTHHSFGVPSADENIASYASAAIGILYAASGLLVFTMNKIAVAGAIVLLLLIIAGRIVMLLAGLYPIDTTRQILALSAGTAIAAGFALHIGLQWHRFK